MRHLRSWFSRLVGVFAKARRDRELANELDAHVQQHIDDSLRTGMTRDEARRVALLKLGGVSQTQESVRDRRGLPLVETAATDVRWALRTLRARPFESFALILVFASAVAASTVLVASFMAVLHDLPTIDSPESVGHVWIVDETSPSGQRQPSLEDFHAWKERTRTLEAVTAVVEEPLTIESGKTVNGLWVAADYFTLARRHPFVGRDFSEADYANPDTILISEKLWHKAFERDPSVIGRQLLIGGRTREIVGIMPLSFWFPVKGVDIWLPLNVRAHAGTGEILGRLAIGRTWPDAQAEFSAMAGTTSKHAVPALYPLVRSLPAETRRKIGPGVEGLIGPALIIFLIACANVGNLLVMRIINRRKELAIRAALGAPTIRLVRLAVVEAVLVGVVGGLLGVVLSIWSTRVLHAAFADINPLAAGALPDVGRLVQSGALVTLLMMAGAGAVPSIFTSRLKLADSLRGPAIRSLTHRFRYSVGDVLVAAQVALAVVLVLVTTLWTKYYFELQRVQDPLLHHEVYVARLTTTPTLSQEARTVVYQRALERSKSLAGVRDAALSTAVPDLRGSRAPVETTWAGGSAQCRATITYVSDGYFDVVGLPLVQGDIQPANGGTSALLSANAARNCFAGGQAGQVRSLSTNRWWPIAGVVANPYANSIVTQASAFVWVIGSDGWPPQVFLLLRPQLGARISAGDLIAAVSGSSTDLTIRQFARLGDLVLQPIGGMRPILMMIGAAAVLSLLLAAAGTYAALTHSCTHRMSELGIRSALGASASRLIVAALSRDLMLIVVGVAVGLVATVWITHVAFDELLLVSAFDARVWVAVAAILFAVGSLASLAPALRAVHVDPVTVLRAE